jgi:catechol 2,3-dioxygenase-like lactoylglutathione lyase family enzyme
MVCINHVALCVGNVEDAIEFYGRIFELELRGRLPGMAFLDMGDQFLALSHSEPGAPDQARHFGLVVDDRAQVRRALQDAGVDIEPGRGLHFSDPWGNRIEVVQYSEIQFTKAPQVLNGMGLEGLGKSESAQRELRDKGIGP